MTTPRFDNPLGTDGFDFVEFTSEDPRGLQLLFESMGFTAVARHRTREALRFTQGDINFILNMEPRSAAINAIAFRVSDAAQALKLAVERGARELESRLGPSQLKVPAIEGIDGTHLYLVDRRGASAIYD